MEYYQKMGKTDKDWIEIVSKNGSMLFRVKDQNEEICLAAERHEGCALEYVKKQTPAICLAAVMEDGWALIFVKEQTDEICLAAVRCKGYALKWVKHQTKKICSEAVKRDFTALQFVKDQDEEICLAAVERRGTMLRHVRKENQTEKICIAAIRSNGNTISMTKNRLEDARQNPYLGYEHKDRLKWEHLKAVKSNNKILEYVFDQTEEICLEAARQDIGALESMRHDVTRKKISQQINDEIYHR